MIPATTADPRDSIIVRQDRILTRLVLKVNRMGAADQITDELHDMSNIAQVRDALGIEVNTDAT